MDAEKLMMQRRIDNLIEQLEIVKKQLEEEKANHQHTLECAQQFEKDWLKMKRERDALLKTIDVEYIASLEEKAIKLEMLEATLKRGLRAENGGAEDA